MARHTQKFATLPAFPPHTNTSIEGERKPRSASERDVAAHIPEPFQSISAQQLVQENCRHCGMIRKESGRVKIWQDRYLILHKGCMYYYSSPEANSAQGQFSLSGYRVVSAPEKLKYQWTFKLVHYQPEKRTYFFAAHSEREMNIWMSSIQEDIAEYASYDSRNENTENPEEGAEDAEEFEGSEEYSYPDVEPLLTKEEFILKCSDAASAQNSKPQQPLYCPPPEFPADSAFVASNPPPPTAAQPFPASPSLHRKTKPLPPTPVKLPSPNPNRQQVKVPPASRPQLKENLWQASLRNPPPAVPPRKTSPAVPPRAKPRKQVVPNLTPTQARSRNTRPDMDEMMKEMNKVLVLQVPGKNGLDEPTEGYLDVVPDQEQTAPMQRGFPDGESFEVDVLPSSAKRLDLDKSAASPLLQSRKGMYLIHCSQTAQSKQAISVCTGDKVRPYLIFQDRALGYALDPKGPRFGTIKELIKYYYDNSLPTCDCRLSRPYMD